MYRFFSILLVAFSAVLFAPAAYAVDLPGSANMLSISLSPQNPVPYSKVTVSPQSTLLNLAEQNIQVLVNGVEVDRGTGSLSSSILLGGPGVATTIQIIATDSSGSKTSAQVVLHPADVSLVIEPNTTSHPFYEGGLLVAPESPVRLVAITDFRTPTGVRLDPKTLIYTWKFGDRILQSDSGIGRSVLHATSPVKYRDADVDLVVQSSDGSLVGEAAVTVAPSDPLVRIYQHDPLLGILFNTALTNTFTMSGAEATFRSVAYYFSGTPTTYSWTVNSAESGMGSDITVRAAGQGKGTALLGVVGTDTAGKTADTILSVLFGSSAGTGIFGL